MEISELKNLIIQQDRTLEILEHIGCKKIRLDGKFYRSTRPNGDNPTACAVNRETLGVTIFTPHEGSGDIFNLVSVAYNLNFTDTVKKIISILGIDDICIEAPKKKKNPADCLLKYKSHNFTEKDMKYYGDELLSGYIQIPNLMWIKEGITADTQNKYDIGYDSKTNRITIPHFSANPLLGKYIGVKGRTLYKDYELWGIKKYLALVEFPKTQSLYGYVQNYLEIEKAGYCVIYESEKSVLKRDSNKDYTGLAISGRDISAYQQKLILSLNVDVIIALDEGISLEEVKKQCAKFAKCRNVYYIFDKEGILQNKQSPADLLDDKFMYLFNKKEKYEE